MPPALLDSQRGSGQQGKEGSSHRGSEGGVGVPSPAAGGAIDPESKSHQSDGFLWPEAVAEISFLPPSSLDLPPPRLGKAREARVGLSGPKAVSKASFIANWSLAGICLWHGVLALVEED